MILVKLELYEGINKIHALKLIRKEEADKLEYYLKSFIETKIRLDNGDTTLLKRENINYKYITIEQYTALKELDILSFGHYYIIDELLYLANKELYLKDIKLKNDNNYK